jgi:imidazolonepropionase
VLPGFVDSHTHLVFAGDRTAEFSMRCGGAGYEEIARSGGGIVVTAEAVRSASEEELASAARGRLDAMLQEGTTTVEIKSGYGLSVEAELKMLRVIRSLQGQTPQTLIPTFLGAHVVPREFKDDRQGYLGLVVEEMLPEIAAAGLARYCDVFCEASAFSLDESRQVLRKAHDLGLGLRVHAEQLHRTGGARLGVEMGAASVDHLEFISEDDVQLLAQSETVATLLPGATLFLGMDAWPPARRLLDAGARVVLATDCNPGSSMTHNLLLMATLGCVRMGMRAEEALASITREAAQGLGMEGEAGVLTAGSRADWVLAEDRDPLGLVYQFGSNRVRGVMCGGEAVRWDGVPCVGGLGS